MKELRLLGQVRRFEWLNKPVAFSQSQVFDSNKTYKFNNRDITVEYSYDITLYVNRELTEKEQNEIKNVINSVLTLYCDRVADNCFLKDFIKSSSNLAELISEKDISINYLAKRYLIANGNDIGFVSNYEIFIDKQQEEVVSI